MIQAGEVGCMGPIVVLVEGQRLLDLLQVALGAVGTAHRQANKIRVGSAGQLSQTSATVSD